MFVCTPKNKKFNIFKFLLIAKNGDVKKLMIGGRLSLLLLIFLQWKCNLYEKNTMPNVN